MAAAAAAAEEAIAADAAAAAAAAEEELETEESEYERGMKRLVELLSKLNPSAKEFFPSSHGGKRGPDRQLSPDAPIYVATNDNYYNNNYSNYLIFDASGNKDLSGNGLYNGQQNRRQEKLELFVKLWIVEDEYALFFHCCRGGMDTTREGEERMIIGREEPKGRIAFGELYMFLT